MTVKTVEIYVATIKPIDFALPDYCRKIQVNAEANGQLPGYLHDNDNPDNISRKNPNYSELTALYSMWKNCTADIQGLCHYRRYISNIDRKLNFVPWSLAIDVRAEKAKSLMLSQERIITELEKADVILTTPGNLTSLNVLEIFTAHVYWHDFRELYRLIEEKYPDYYDSFTHVMNMNRKSIHPANMFIAGRKFVDDYCRWLFGILGEMENRISLEGYSTQRKRIYGYFSEVLLDTYILRHNLRTKSFPCLYVNDDSTPVYILRKFPGFMKTYCFWRDREMRKLARLDDFLAGNPNTEDVKKYMLSIGAKNTGKFLCLEARNKLRLAPKICAVYMPCDENDDFLPALYQELSSMQEKANRENVTLIPRIILSAETARNVKAPLFDAGVRILEY